jgi:hypothetical protein
MIILFFVSGIKPLPGFGCVAHCCSCNRLSVPRYLSRKDGKEARATYNFIPWLLTFFCVLRAIFTAHPSVGVPPTERLFSTKKSKYFDN